MSARVVASMAAPSLRRARGPVALALILTTLLALLVGLLALGTWQVQRRAWKLDLIERVDARVHAAPVAPPARGDWPMVDAARDEYRHVALRGRYLAGHDTRVQAVTERGAGFWLLSPLQQADGTIVLVNRGFVPGGWQSDASPSERPTTITGLLRMSEPRGGFLRRNAPADDRWYSRDVPAIAAARGLRDVAPYFVDADAVPAATASTSAANTVSETPIGGLTVVRFRNNHLVYALTWYGLALLVCYAGWRVAREKRTLRAGARRRDHAARRDDGTRDEDPHADARHRATRHDDRPRHA